MNSLQATGPALAKSDLTTKPWPVPGFPTFDVGALLNGHRRNVEALAKANRVVFDGVRMFAQREREMLRSSVRRGANGTAGDLTGTSVEESATKTKQIGGAERASPLAGLAELSGLAVKINVSVMEILNARVTEGFNELKTLFTGPGAPAKVNSPAPLRSVPVVADVDEVSLARDEVSLAGNAIAAVAPAETVTPRSPPRTARVAKGHTTPARASRPATKTKARARKAGRRRTIHK